VVSPFHRITLYKSTFTYLLTPTNTKCDLLDWHTPELAWHPHLLAQMLYWLITVVWALLMWWHVTHCGCRVLFSVFMEGGRTSP